jgi:hypothetical protein
VTDMWSESTRVKMLSEGKRIEAISELEGIGSEAETNGHLERSLDNSDSKTANLVLVG